ncbi:T6SS immunity protein Tli4 family protein [Photorhabdus sp. APURE]|uniref:T6SS immunity protein Tli4 family protein n=1 Tax=Photorhabdus aballayi TaxID=2991723 RepID=UPI00223DEC72|nr:T6SS immunity protein Tli4 family protein [Photorhabdus aballayi]MCW7547763.1 T6SS immunity protein Tli4 family protein [Photorhabdus aballayi]
MKTEILTNMPTRCIGHYLIDIPLVFENIINNEIYIGDAKIETKRMHLSAFEQRIEIREQKLRTTKTTDLKDLPFLKKAHHLQGNLYGVIFDRNQNISEPGFSRILETHLYDNGVAFMIEMKFTEISDDKYSYSRDRYIKSGLHENQYKMLSQTLDKMQRLIARISGRKDSDIPTEAGICIPDGFIAGHDNDKENMMFVYQGNQDSNFTFSVAIINDFKGEGILLERISKIERDWFINYGKIIRKEEREINGIYGEELLAVGLQSFDNNPRYRFDFIANDMALDDKNVGVGVILMNYQLPATPYTEDELIMFWEAITKTFRKRPGAFE